MEPEGHELAASAQPRWDEEQIDRGCYDCAKPSACSIWWGGTSSGFKRFDS